MIITNKTLPRRTFLRGVGATMALPVLDSMFSPLTAVAQTMKKAPVRLGYVYTPNGIIGCNDKSPRQFLWTPTDTGANFEFSPTMKALEPFREHINVYQRPGAGHGPRARRRSRRPRARDRDIAHRRASVQDRAARTSSSAFRPTRSRRRSSASTRSWRRSSSGSNSRRSPATATRATRARTCRCRGGPRPARCRLKSTRAWCSSGCSATAKAPSRRRAWRGSRARRACSTTSPTA